MGPDLAGRGGRTIRPAGPRWCHRLCELSPARGTVNGFTARLPQARMIDGRRSNRRRAAVKGFDIAFALASAAVLMGWWLMLWTAVARAWTLIG